MEERKREDLTMGLTWHREKERNYREETGEAWSVIRLAAAMVNRGEVVAGEAKNGFPRRR